VTDSERSASDPSDDEAIEQMVAEHLDRRARQTDAGSLLARIRLSQQVEKALAPPVPEHSAGRVPISGSLADPISDKAVARRWFAAVSWPLLTSVALLLAFFVGHQWSPLTANAAAALRDLQAVHQREIDRCYRVQYAPDPRFWDASNQLEGPSNSLLWTRGDRFWSDCRLADLRLKMGRAEDGNLWITPSPEKGIQFASEAANLPQEVSLLCTVNAMTVPRLVDRVLADFELRIDPSRTGSPPSRTVVWATLKPGHTHPLIESALLEIDPETGALMGLVLSMVRDGQPRGTVTYTFLEAAVQNDALYELRTHLNDGATIETQSFQNVL
jgi:hypothetical protein